VRWLVLAAVASTLLRGCGPAPVYDEELGIQAVELEEGALAGTFALYSVTTNLIQVPLFGDEEGGGVNYILVNRDYDEATGKYTQETRLCGGYNFEVGGVTSGPPTETYPLVPGSFGEEVEVEHQLGTIGVTGMVQLWGVRGILDPLASPMPEDAEEAERLDMIYDMDGDGEPGVTAQVSGLFTGRVFFIQRKLLELNGLALGPDRVVGLTTSRYEMIILGDTFSFWDPGDGSANPHPDPQKSWFEERRLPTGSACGAVLEAVFEGGLGETKPF